MITKGIKTSEFWVALVGIGTLAWQFIQQNCSIDTPKLLAFAGIVITYIASRTYIKSKQPQ